MRVKALKLCFYGNKRQKPGAIFDIDDKVLKKGEDGSPVLPKWLEKAEPDNVPTLIVQQRSDKRVSREETDEVI